MFEDIHVEYVDHMGDDLRVVDSARVSFNKQSETLKNGMLKSADCNLINYLAEHNHFTPFTHGVITLRETVPIFVARQRFKSVVGFSYNEVSRRYVDEDPTFYRPDGWRLKAKNVKQGSSDKVYNADRTLEALYEARINSCFDLYRTMLNEGICAEQARMVLPQSMMTSYIVTGSLAAYARMCKLRLDSHAQKEIQYLAQQVSDIIEPLYPVAWAKLMEQP